MNSIGFIASQPEKLPLELCRKWVTVALEIQTQSSCLAGLPDFANFVITASWRLILHTIRPYFLPKHTRVMEIA